MQPNDLLINLAQKYETPLYVYDASIISRQYQNMLTAFTGLNVKIKYACKALTNIHIIKHLKSLGAGIDCVSIQEIKIAIMAGYEANQIMFTPNCTPFSEIEEAIALGVNINLDSLSFLEKFGSKYGSTIPVCIRINPHIMAGGNIKISTGHKDSKFGISILQKAEILAICSKYKLNVNGLHVHSGSDFSNTDAFIESSNLMFDLAFEFPDLKFMDFGSGFKVPYKAGDHATDLVALGKKLQATYLEFTKKYKREIEIWFEPGKFLVSDCGVLLVTVSVVKETPESTFVGVNSGLNHLIRPMMYDAYHEIVNISNPDGKPKPYNIVGYICETDNFAWNRTMPEIREGDILGILNAGAYGMSMASQYNSRPRPAEVMLKNDADILIRKRETFEDVISMWV